MREYCIIIFYNAIETTSVQHSQCDMLVAYVGKLQWLSCILIFYGMALITIFDVQLDT